MDMEKMIKKMEIHIKDILSQIKDKEMEYINILLQDNNIMDNGKIIKNMDMEYLNIHMDKNIKEIGIMIKDKDKVNYIIIITLYIKVHSKIISNMDMVLLHIKMVIFIKEIFKMVKKKDLDKYFI